MQIDLTILLGLVAAVLALFGWGVNERSRRKRSESQAKLDQKFLKQQREARQRMAAKIREVKKRVQDSKDAAKIIADRYSRDYSDR